MKVILKIAWRNIWRNPRRSWVLISTIAIGIFGFLGTMSFIKGMVYQMVDSMINLNAGHIQVAAKGYNDNPSIRLFIKEPGEVEKALTDISGIRYSQQVSFQGMANSSETASGVIISGIDPVREPDVTVISRLIIEGSYLSEDGRNEVVIGKELTRRLNVTLEEKIVLMASSLTGEINSGAYRVTGIFKSVSPDFDRASVFIHMRNAQGLAGYTDEVSAYIIRLPQEADLNKTINLIKKKLPSLEALSWMDRFPIVVISLESFDTFAVIFIAIVFTAVAFSIINTFLMVIYERIREIGIMMAVGIFPGKVRSILFLEALFITLIGTAFGAVLTAGIIGYFGHFGLDLSVISKGLGKYGIAPVVYPSLELSDIVSALLAVNIIVTLAVIYPAVKASRFKVVDAINFS